MSLNLFALPSPPSLSLRSLAPLARRWNSSAPAYSPRTPRRSLGRKKYYEDQKSHNESRALEKFQSREWKDGDVYSPHDLSASEMRKWRKRHSPATDALDALQLNPLDLYKNYSVMSEYITPMGRIRHRSHTGLRPVNQRKMAKAIRRAIGLGIMPSVHKHPEILAAEAMGRFERGSR